MKIKETIGLDMSKEKFDARIHSNQNYEVFENSFKGVNNLLKWVDKNSPFKKEEIMFVFEHMGLYSYQISVFLSEQKVPFVMMPGLAIKRSLGIARGKDDKIDATKIALYGYRLRDELQPTKLASRQVASVKRLLSLRDRLVKQRAGYKASFKEQSKVLSKKDNRLLLNTQEKMMHYLSKQIANIEKELQILIDSDKTLKQAYDLLIGIKGVGPQTALYMIVLTNGFVKFKNYRKFASFCGVAPFPNQSGKLNKGSKISHLANKKMKTLLDLCAKSAIKHNNEIKQYYERRIGQDKNKRSTINIVRNKLLARMFAVVQRGTPYVNTMKHIA